MSLCVGRVPRPGARAATEASYHGFQCFNPLAKGDGALALVGDEVNVVGHDDETATEPAVVFRAVQEKCRKAPKGRFIIENTIASIDTDGQQERNGSMAIRRDTRQTA